MWERPCKLGHNFLHHFLLRSFQHRRTDGKYCAMLIDKSWFLPGHKRKLKGMSQGHTPTFACGFPWSVCTEGIVVEPHTIHNIAKENIIMEAKPFNKICIFKSVTVRFLPSLNYTGNSVLNWYNRNKAIVTCQLCEKWNNSKVRGELSRPDY